MPWFKDVIAAITGNGVDLDAVKQKLSNGDERAVLSKAELEAYLNDIQKRVQVMIKDLRSIYRKYGVTFNGFSSFKQSFVDLHEIIKNGTEENYNTLIKTESSISSELKRHLGLIKMAIDKNGIKVIDQINKDPYLQAQFNSIFGSRDSRTGQYNDGIYQRLWSEIHRLTEYVIVQKDKVVH